jgi:hypothetical protein
MPAPTEPTSVLTASSAPAGIVGPANSHAQGIGIAQLTRVIEGEVQSLATILGVGEGEPLDAPLVTIELACERIRQLGPRAGF